MLKSEEYFESNFIIWNSELGVRDIVTIGKTEVESDTTNGWLEEPYEMVGPFNLDELIIIGQINFAACYVMTHQYWEKNMKRLQQESLTKQRIAQQQFYDDINRYNNKRKQDLSNFKQSNQEEHRRTLCLPIEGLLEISQIKTAYRILVKKTHPDVGGSDEEFIKITQARDALLENEELKKI
ncbi:MAG: J domain-containing protein [Campylobacterota bacterium]|nr:J domain-containing protein [Campylobacterota bacterium]